MRLRSGLFFSLHLIVYNHKYQNHTCVTSVHPFLIKT